jgi:hypothetical protein
MKNVGLIMQYAGMMIQALVLRTCAGERGLSLYQQYTLMWLTYDDRGRPCHRESL